MKAFIFVSHTMDSSGAPTSLKNVLSEIKENHSIEAHVVAMRGGSQVESFRPLCNSIKILSSSSSTGMAFSVVNFLKLLVFLAKYDKGTRVLINSTTNLRAMVACKLLGFRSFVYVRESEEMVTEYRLGFLRIYLLRFMTGVICVSHSTAKWVSKYVAEDKIKILHNGIKLEAASLDYPRQWTKGEEPVIGIIGRLDYRKGIDRFYALVDFCNKHQTFYQYKIIGEITAERFYLSNYRGQFRDKTQVTMTGLIKDVIPEIAECSVILMLSRQEALPRVVLEAGSVGVPVLALDVAGTKEMLPENYKWVLPEETKIASLAVHLAALLKEDSNGSVGHGNKKFIEQNFDRGVLVGELIKFISI